MVPFPNQRAIYEHILKNFNKNAPSDFMMVKQLTSQTNEDANKRRPFLRRYVPKKIEDSGQ